jgi:hypothetical protein
MDLLVQLLAWLQSLGAATSVEVKIAGLVTLLVGLTKSSFAAPYLAKLGNFSVLVAPVLGVVLALLGLPGISSATVLAGLHGGSLAIAVAALLEAVKSVPGVGGVYVSLINLVEKLLGAPPVV